MDLLVKSLKTELCKVVMLDWCQIWFLPNEYLYLEVGSSKFLWNIGACL